MWDWLSGLGGNVASGIGNFMGGSYGDPNAYIAGMSSLAGLGGNYFSQQQQQANYHKQLMAQRQAMAQQQQLGQQYNQLAGTPVDPSAYYKPMSDAESAALQRSLSANMATSGIPFDSSYARNMIAEEMAKTENQRMQQAYGQAFNQRGSQLQGLQSQMSQFPGTTMALPNMPQLGQYGMNAFPQYMAQQSQQKMQMDALNKILAAQRGGQQSTPGAVDTSSLGNLDLQLGLGGKMMGSDPQGSSVPTYGSQSSGGAY